MKDFKKNIQTSLMFYFGFFCVVLGVIKLMFGEVAGGGGVVGTGLVLILLSHFDVEMIKLPFLEAKLRKTLNEAEEILARLKGISLPVSEIALTTASQTGLYSRKIPRKMLYDYVIDISTELKGMGVPEEKIEGVKQSWYSVTAAEISRPIASIIANEFKSVFTELDGKYNDMRRCSDNYTHDELDEIHFLHGEIQSDLHYFNKELDLFRKDYEALPEFFNRKIKDSQALKEGDKEKIFKSIHEDMLDLNFFIINKEIRRPELWFSRI
ncbi:hypothetical protein J3D56_001827 [Erwinia persicina]|uniref:hypothetical protein n=1 Tax=Erwinia persicina TaxID=55211 RepID=UPI00209D5012|nr:hypothetical protein [Erwinia persicina]MCP1438391.1 hypothetical protein [Erwinia persicina]